MGKLNIKTWIKYFGNTTPEEVIESVGGVEKSITHPYELTLNRIIEKYSIHPDLYIEYDELIWWMMTPSFWGRELKKYLAK